MEFHSQSKLAAWASSTEDPPANNPRSLYHLSLTGSTLCHGVYPLCNHNNSSRKKWMQHKEDHTGNEWHRKIIVNTHPFPQTDGEKLKDSIRERGYKDEG